MSRRILITGAAGFIGSHLSEKLLKLGNHVTGIDNFQTSDPDNIHHLKQFQKWEFRNGDVRRADVFKGDFDFIYNLACPASPVHYQSDPIGTIETNFLGAHNSLITANKNKARILQASTSEIYGDPLEHPQKETYFGNVNTLGPRSCYDEGKRIAETLFYDFHRKFNVDIRIARIFNTYGPKMAENDGRVVSEFILKAMENKPLSIFGDGTQTRSFCYVYDLVEGLVAIMDSDKPYNGPFNLGNPAEFSINELARQVVIKLDSKSFAEYLPGRQDEPRIRQPDIRKIHSQLGWFPQIELSEGLDKTIEYFKNKRLVKESRCELKLNAPEQSSSI